MKIARKIKVAFVVLLMLFVARGVLAQTPGGDDQRPTPKWVQPPDRKTTGVDVKVTLPKVLADDFLCTETGPITGIRIWNSWLYDQLPPRGPGQVAFALGIFSDIPASDVPGGFGFSRPGELLWGKIFRPGDFSVRLFDEVCGEGWYDPCETYIYPADEQIWQYTFHIDPEEAFIQEGNPEEPMVYWLGVTAWTPDLQAFQLGWKTSRRHWNDDAVWADIELGNLGGPNFTDTFTAIDGLPNPNELQWLELRYPEGHPWAGRSIDLAFALVPEPATMLVLALGLIPAMLLRRRRKA